jgi:hypothetical protein
MGFLWWIMGSAIFKSTSGGICVGPGANKYRFCIVNLLKFDVTFYQITMKNVKQNDNTKGEDFVLYFTDATKDI